MTPERWNLVTELFHRALDRAPEDRAAFLEAECQDDELRREVESLLAAALAGDTGDAFLESAPHVSHLGSGIRRCPGDLIAETVEGAADPLLGATLDEKYRIEALLGRGGMGAVYLARQLHLDRQVAVKLLHPATAGDVALARFKREAFAVARLRHPNIVGLFDFGISAEAGAYLVMEYLEGESLRAALARRSPFAVELAIDITRQICGALRAVHATATATSSPTTSSFRARSTARSSRSSTSAWRSLRAGARC
jgi:hypothetical protein